MTINPLSGQNNNLSATPGRIKDPDKQGLPPRDVFTPGSGKGLFPNRETVRANIRRHGLSGPTESKEVSLPLEESSTTGTTWLTKTLAGVFIGTTLLGMAGCTDGPPPEPGEEPTSISTELSYILINSKDEIELGKQVAEHIEKETPLWNNEAAQQRINKLGESLAATSIREDLPYTFKLLDTDMINAFALPGGHIYVTRGLHEEFKDDNELLFILGHEMGHIEDRDSIKRIERDVAFRALIKVLGDKKGDMAEVLGTVAAGLTNIQFSQKDELQADSMAARHMIRNKVNPWYGVRAMEHLNSLGKSSPDLIQKIFSTHPPTGERVENLKDIARDHPQP